VSIVTLIYMLLMKMAQPRPALPPAPWLSVNESRWLAIERQQRINRGRAPAPKE
jgi:hypothetical protein